MGSHIRPQRHPGLGLLLESAEAGKSLVLSMTEEGAGVDRCYQRGCGQAPARVTAVAQETARSVDLRIKTWPEANISGAEATAEIVEASRYNSKSTDVKIFLKFIPLPQNVIEFHCIL